jgi:dTDP-4-dehydrorhamnose reductase
MKVLVLGASGMLGNAVFRFLAESENISVTGTVRSGGSVRLFKPDLQKHLVLGVDVERDEVLARLFDQVKPEVVINSVGLVKQLADADDPLSALPINALLPHRLARLCQTANARLIHISTDCVFSGSKGMYREEDFPDANDLYGRSKYLGEVDYPHAITLRTSIIGHELNGAHSLVGWFLSQTGAAKGFRCAVFSGLPTVELARVIRDYVMPRPELHGRYHVSAEPVNKFDLLRLLAQIYQKEIEITPDDRLVIDRSLDSGRFRSVTGYHPPHWPELVQRMREFG